MYGQWFCRKYLKKVRIIRVMKANDNSSYIVTRLFWKIFPVQFFLAAIAPINALIDNLIASNAIGSDAVAGVALFSPLSGFLNGVSGLLAVGEFIALLIGLTFG